jgi:SAM-dependent methyltransferase
VADLPFTFTNRLIASRLQQAVDVEGKIPRAIAEIGEIAGRDVVALRTDGRRAAELRALDAHVTASAEDGAELRPGCADVVVRFWGESGAVALPDQQAMSAIARLLRPDGRVLLVMDYGRDEVARLRPEGETPEVYRALRARDAEYAARGFKLRVLHGWWTFESLEDARSFLVDAFGERGERVAEAMRRPRLSHKVVIYHRAGADGLAQSAARSETTAVAGVRRAAGRERTRGA